MKDVCGHLNGLNPSQRAAAEYGTAGLPRELPGPLLIIAGAGTGKTTPMKPATGAPAPGPLMTPEQAADYLQIHRRQLQRCGVPHVVVSHKVRRYLQSDLDAWIAARRRAA